MAESNSPSIPMSWGCVIIAGVVAYCVWSYHDSPQPARHVQPPPPTPEPVEPEVRIERAVAVSKTTPKTARPVAKKKAVPDRNVAIAAAEQQGFLRMDRSTHRAWIDPVLWLGMDAQLKENFCAAMALQIEEQTGDAAWVEVYDKQSAKKLAKFGVWGFTVY